MQERISAYVQSLTVKEKSGYELAARVCAKYFDERGIYSPTESDWDAFKEYYRQQYQREKGKALAEVTLQTKYIYHGKAFYRWCAEHDAEQFHATATTETTPPPTPQQAPQHETTSPPASDEAEKVRVNFLLNGNMHEALMSLAYLKGDTLTAIITEAVEAYIKGYEEQIAVLRATRRKLRGE